MENKQKVTLSSDGLPLAVSPGGEQKSSGNQENGETPYILEYALTDITCKRPVGAVSDNLHITRKSTHRYARFT